jgi:hypothetical protein
MFPPFQALTNYKQVVVVLMAWNCILKVLGMWFSSILPGKCWDSTFIRPWLLPCKFLSNSLLSNHPTIWCYIVRCWDHCKINHTKRFKFLCIRVTFIGRNDIFVCSGKFPSLDRFSKLKFLGEWSVYFIWFTIFLYDMPFRKLWSLIPSSCTESITLNLTRIKI